MKSLSIRQPWAWAIIYGGKEVENRTWPTKFRGRFLVHASKSFDQKGYEWIANNENRLGLQLPQIEEFRLGGIIGSIEIFDCVANHGSLWFFGPYGFVLRNPEPMRFKECKGKLGFFDLII